MSVGGLDLHLRLESKERVAVLGFRHGITAYYWGRGYWNLGMVARAGSHAPWVEKLLGR